MTVDGMEGEERILEVGDGTIVAYMYHNGRTYEATAYGESHQGQDHTYRSGLETRN